MMSLFDLFLSFMPPNGIGFSGGVRIDQESYRAEARFQNRLDLVGA